MNVLKLLGANAVAAAPSKTVSYIGGGSNGTSATTYNFTNTSIGTESSDRLVVVCIIGDSSSTRSISSCSIAGSSATFVTGRNSVQTPTAIYSRVVTTGTTATISVTFSASMNRAAIYVYTITGLDSTTATATASVTNTNDAAINGIEGSVVIAFARIVVSGLTSTWTNATKDFESMPSGWFVDSAVASNSSAPASLTITCDWGSTSTSRAINAARWF